MGTKHAEDLRFEDTTQYQESVEAALKNTREKQRMVTQRGDLDSN